MAYAEGFVADQATSHPHPTASKRLRGEAVKCLPVDGSGQLAAENVAILAVQLKALADVSRLRILSIVSSAPESETCVCNITAPLGLGQPTVSHHLKVLVEAGLLAREKRGVWVYYSIVPGAVAGVTQALHGAVEAGDINS